MNYELPVSDMLQRNCLNFVTIIRGAETLICLSDEWGREYLSTTAQRNHDQQINMLNDRGKYYWAFDQHHLLSDWSE